VFVNRIIASYFAEFAREWSPSQVWPLVGGFLLLRYVNPALSTPEVYGLLPDGKLPSAKARRNLVLITKILQNLSNGVEFGKKELYMMKVNSFIVEYKKKMESYFQTVISFTSKSGYSSGMQKNFHISFRFLLIPLFLFYL
jgi:hypothetical protein